MKKKMSREDFELLQSLVLIMKDALMIKGSEKLPFNIYGYAEAAERIINYSKFKRYLIACDKAAKKYNKGAK